LAIKQDFKPAWWLPGAHLQTLWATLARRRLQIPRKIERLELPDGDFLDLAWVGNGQGPLILVLHGLNGSIESPYLKIFQAIEQRGWRGVLMHFRGCSGEPNRLARSYHSGETGDLQYVIDELKRREPQTPLWVLGYSLGGNVLLKWLGETGAKPGPKLELSPIHAAVAVSVPFELAKTADKLNSGASRFYQWWLLRGLNAAHQHKFKTISPATSLEGKLKKPRTFWEFDEAITAPLHGFDSAADYYHQSSSRPYLSSIKIPTLILHARNDPFTSLSALPNEQDISLAVTLEITDAGGHLGFVAGKNPYKPIYWLEDRILDYFQSQL